MMWLLRDYEAYIPLVSALSVSIIMIHTIYETKKNVCQSVLAWAITAIALVGIVHHISPFFSGITKETICIIVSVIFILTYRYLFPQISWQQRTFTYLFINNSLYIIMLTARTITIAFGSRIDVNQAGQLFLTLYLIGAVFFAVSFALELREVLLKCLEVYVEKINSMLIFAGLNYFGILIIGRVWQPWQLDDIKLFFINSAITAIEICAYITAFSSLTSLGDKLVSETEAKVAKEQLVLADKYYDSIVENVNQTRIYNHNLKYFVNSVSALAETGDKEGIKHFIDNLKLELPDSAPIWSKVPEIDAIISACNNQCNKEMIDFKCDFMYPRNLEINTLHMCIMLGNCLQNAVDACKRLVGEERRFIKLYCFPTNNKLVLCVENSFDGVIKQGKDGVLLSRKETDRELHGFGVESVQQTAEKYHGNCSWEAEGNVFRMNVLLLAPTLEK